VQRLGQCSGALFQLLPRVFGQRLIATQPPHVLKADVRQRGGDGSEQRGGLRFMRADAQALVPIGVGQGAAHRLQTFRAVRADEQRFVDVGLAQGIET
jgi:hypothetical protein